MEGVSTPPQHRYNTRSSQTPPQSTVSSSGRSGVNNTYRMRADIVVKETVYGRDHNGKRLQPQIFEGSSWEAIKAKIFEFARPHVKSLASHVSEPRVWTVSAEEPTMDQFELFVTMKMGRNHFRPSSINQAHQYLADHINKTFSISLFKWGGHIHSAADLIEFHNQCVAPSVQDRAGAAAEVMQQQMVETLKARWGDVYSAFEATWRIWAAQILRLPSHEHEAVTARPPPSTLIHLFESVRTGAQVRNESLRQSLSLARDVVDSCLRDVATVVDEVADLSSRVQALSEMLKTKQRVIESFSREVEAPHPDQGLHEVLRSIPNMNDVEHAEESP